jgi:hypothetical protein
MVNTVGIKPTMFVCLIKSQSPSSLGSRIHIIKELEDVGGIEPPVFVYRIKSPSPSPLG